MKYLVLGGCGFIGSHLVDRLVENEVMVLDDLSTGSLDNLPFNPNVMFERRSILGDIGKYFEGVDVVFHLAAKTRPQESIKEPELYNKINIDGTLNVLKNCVEHKVKRLVFVSSSSLYGIQEGPSHEDVTPNPMSPYALTKLIGEQYCRLYQRLYNLQSNYIRPFNVFGKRQPPGGGYAAVVPSFIDALKKGEQPFITGDGEQRRDFVFVEDVVDLIILASESKVYGEAFNAGLGKNVSINELYKTICTLMGKDVEPKYVEAVFEPREVLADITKAKELLGYTPKFTLEEGLRTML
ncbi:MAG: NAD-dependent epimerase/dehydratase family protein [Candidatus Izemoplasmatales bacterium]